MMGAVVVAAVVTAVPHHPHRQAKVAHAVGVGQHSPLAPGTGWRVVLVVVADVRGGGASRSGGGILGGGGFTRPEGPRVMDAGGGGGGPVVAVAPLGSTTEGTGGGPLSTEPGTGTGVGGGA
jgi:hypothetical protein